MKQLCLFFFFKIESLLDQVEQYKDNLSKKDEEILQLNLQLEIHKNLSTSNIIQLQAENAHLQVGSSSFSALPKMSETYFLEC